jgi:hypothetical protein
MAQKDGMNIPEGRQHPGTLPSFCHNVSVVCQIGLFQCSCRKSPAAIQAAITCRDRKKTRIGTDMPNNNNTQGRLIAADFLTHTVKAFLIGVTTSVVLAGAVILLAQSGGEDESAFSNDTPAMEEAK